jgi:hypothetical protein
VAEEAGLVFSLGRSGFDTRRLEVGFVVGKVALAQGFLLELLVSSVIIIPPTLHVNSCGH